MKYALNAKMAKEVDDYTISKIGIPSEVLMERAAVAVAMKTAEIATLFNRRTKILAVVGNGNNGADGVAVARILFWQGLDVDILMAVPNGKKTREFELQEKIAINAGISFVNRDKISEYDIIVDGIFGVGLSRPVEEEISSIINTINENNNIVVSVDIPSGVDATTGKILGNAIKANATVTFGYNKTGLMLYPGKKWAGEITVSDIGFSPDAIKTLNPAMYFTKQDLYKIPERIPDSNKGNYGRTVIIAGSEDMSGAAYLSGAAAFSAGVGLVEIVSHNNNKDILKKLLPEAIVKGYKDDNALQIVSEAMERASGIILGPGLSKSATAKSITKYVMENGKTPIIVDADALNIISEDISLLKRYNNTVIITPHIGEMTRIAKLSKDEILENSLYTAQEFAKENNVILVMKDAITIVAEPGENGREYINVSGTGGMSKAGSGDVLTGIIAGMLALKIEPFSAASMAVYIHGLAGELAVMDKGEHALLASDIIANVGKVMSLER